jgi:hypothetical protein
VHEASWQVRGQIRIGHLGGILVAVLLYLLQRGLDGGRVGLQDPPALTFLDGLEVVADEPGRRLLKLVGVVKNGQLDSIKFSIAYFLLPKPFHSPETIRGIMIRTRVRIQ